MALVLSDSIGIIWSFTTDTSDVSMEKNMRRLRGVSSSCVFSFSFTSSSLLGVLLCCLPSKTKPRVKPGATTRRSELTEKRQLYFLFLVQSLFQSSLSLLPSFSLFSISTLTLLKIEQCLVCLDAWWKTRVGRGGTREIETAGNERHMVRGATKTQRVIKDEKEGIGEDVSLYSDIVLSLSSHPLLYSLCLRYQPHHLISLPFLLYLLPSVDITILPVFPYR